MDDFRQMISLRRAHQRRHHHPGPHRRRGHPRPELGHPAATPAWTSRRSPTTSSAPCPWPPAGSGSCSRQIIRYLDQALAAGRLGHDLGEDPALRRRAAPRSSSATPAAPPPPWPATWTPPSSSSPSSTAAPATARTSHDRQAAGPLRIHPDAVRPRPGPRHAAPPRRPQRGRRPHHLVHHRTRDRRDHRRSRRRQDRRRPRRPGRPGRLPAHHHLPAQPHDRRPRPARDDRRHLRRPARPHRLPAHRPGLRRPGRRTRRTRPHPRPGHRRSPPAALRAARDHPDAHQPQPRLRLTRSPACSSASPPCAAP